MGGIVDAVSDFIIPAVGASIGYMVGGPWGAAVGAGLGFAVSPPGAPAETEATTVDTPSWQSYMPMPDMGPSAEERAYYQAQTAALEQQQADAAQAEAEAEAAEAETKARAQRRASAAAKGRRSSNPTGSQGLLGDVAVKKKGLLGS
jgi:hypothetical protein